MKAWMRDPDRTQMRLMRRPIWGRNGGGARPLTLYRSPGHGHTTPSSAAVNIRARRIGGAVEQMSRLRELLGAARRRPPSHKGREAASPARRFEDAATQAPRSARACTRVWARRVWTDKPMCEEKAYATRHYAPHGEDADGRADAHPAE